MLIDMHSHYYGGLVDALRLRHARPCVADNDEGKPVLHAMTASTVMSPGYTELPPRLDYMRRTGIDRQVLTFPGALGVDAMPAADVAGAIGFFNDRLADLCRTSGGVFIGLAGLPLADMAAAAAEMRRARRELGLVGAILPGNYFLSAARAETLRPVLAAANEIGALILVHPGVAPGDEVPTPYADNNVYRMSGLALQASVAQMGITLMFGPLLDDYPDITIQLIALGGTLPFVVERLDGIAASRGLSGPVPSSLLRRLYYDCASLGPRALEMAVKVIGADRIVLGTDYPIFAPDPLREVLARADISDADRAQIAHGTARSILDRLG